ncbi:MAG: putative photosynthetic complex assembly protein PuhC [Rhizobiaceae bacterium]|nr:putative photosynthetic complex assembly protein PuhC [Rhizobiaceae bacterium]
MTIAQPHLAPAPGPARERQARLMIKIVFGIAGLALALAVLAQTTGIGAEKVVRGQPVQSRLVTIMAEPDGALVMRDAASGATLARHAPGEGGFMRGLIRALSLRRDAQHVAPATPYELRRWDSSRITLNDPATGHQLPLDTFTPAVTRMFAPLVGSAVQQQAPTKHQTQGN